MTQLTTLTGVILDDETEFTLADLSRACSVHAEWVVSLVEEGILEPHEIEANERHWRFTGTSLHRARTASRLQRDLSVNLAGVALALELIDEIDSLRSRLAGMERCD